MACSIFSCCSVSMFSFISVRVLYGLTLYIHQNRKKIGSPRIMSMFNLYEDFFT